MEPDLSQTNGRYSRAASEARSKNPLGVSRKEGWLVLTVAAGAGVLLAVSFQAHSWEWGGIIRLVSQIGFLVLLVTVISGIAPARGVHPVGHRLRLLVAGAFATLVAVIGGWFWTVPQVHGASWTVTTTVAIIAVMPLALIGVQLIAKGRK